MYVTARNSTGGPVTVDGAGAVLGAGLWGTVDTSEPSVQAAATAGELELYPFGVADGPGQPAAAVTADERTARLESDRVVSIAEDQAQQAATALQNAVVQAEAAATSAQQAATKAEQAAGITV